MAKSGAATVAGYLRELPAERNHNALYLTDVYQNSSQAKRLKDGFRKAGKKLDMGKSCIRFKKLEDIYARL